MRTWFKIFYRNAKKNWLNIIINILGLTLGLVGLILVLLYINDEKSYNQWNPYKNDVYRVAQKLSNGKIYMVSTGVEGPKYTEEIPDVIDNIMIYPWYERQIVKSKNKSFYLSKITIAQKNFFDFFPYKIVKGSVKKYTESNTNMALSIKTAEKYFGTIDNAMGKTLEMLGAKYIVTTIYKNEGKSYFSPEIIKHFLHSVVSDWNNYNYALFIKLDKNPDLNKIQKMMHDIYVKYKYIPDAKKEGISLEKYYEKFGDKELVLEKLSEIRFKNIANEAGPEGQGNNQTLLVLLGLSILLIVISCVNFINLSTASASQRAKEVGVKKNLGLQKSNLIFQYTLEIVFQGIVSLLLALLLVELLLPYYNEFTGKSIVLLNLPILIKVFLITVLISIFIGLIPALYLSNFKAIEVLKGNFSRSKKGVFVRNLMLALQILISGFFIIGVFIINSQIKYMMGKDLGFSGEQIINVNLNDDTNRFKKYELVKKVLINHKNIMAISSCNITPGYTRTSATSMSYKDKSRVTLSNIVDHNYIDFSKIKVLKGRSFSEKFASDTIKNVILNESAAKAMGIYDDPIGKKIKIGWIKDKDDFRLEVIGMINDYNVKGFDNKIEPMFILHWRTYDWTKNWLTRIQFKIKTENVKETINYIEKYWQKNVEQGFPFTYSFVDQKFAKTYEKYQKQQKLFLILSIAVILISLLGLFAFASLTIQQRFKEVAIRKTLGASEKEIVTQLVKGFLKVTFLVIIFLLPIAYYFMQNWLENFVYRIDMPIWPYLITPIILLILVFSVVGIKAYNATKVDLIKYLKFE